MVWERFGVGKVNYEQSVVGVGDSWTRELRAKAGQMLVYEYFANRNFEITVENGQSPPPPNEKSVLRKWRLFAAALSHEHADAGGRGRRAGEKGYANSGGGEEPEQADEDEAASGLSFNRLTKRHKTHFLFL